MKPKLQFLPILNFFYTAKKYKILKYSIKLPQVLHCFSRLRPPLATPFWMLPLPYLAFQTLHCLLPSLPFWPDVNSYRSEAPLVQRCPFNIQNPGWEWNVCSIDSWQMNWKKEACSSWPCLRETSSDFLLVF